MAQKMPLEQYGGHQVTAQRQPQGYHTGSSQKQHLLLPGLALVQTKKPSHRIEAVVAVVGIGKFADLDLGQMQKLVGVAAQNRLDGFAVGLRQMG